MFMNILTYTHVYMYTYIYIYICMYTYIYIHIRVVTTDKARKEDGTDSSVSVARTYMHAWGSAALLALLSSIRSS